MPENWFAKKLGTPVPQGAGLRPVQSQTYVKPEYRMPSNYQTSPDGLWLWNGVEWIPNDQQQVPAPPPPPPVVLPPQAAQVARHLGTAECPQCGIDDTFMMQPNKKRRCFSCGYSELETMPVNSTSFDTSRGGTGGEVKATRNQSGGGWAGEKNTVAPSYTREYQ